MPLLFCMGFCEVVITDKGFVVHGDAGDDVLIIHFAAFLLKMIFQLLKFLLLLLLLLLPIKLIAV